MSITLRSNQIEPVSIGINYLKEVNPVPSIIVMPTAAGKSHVIAHIAKGVGEKLLVIQPSIDLLLQNYEKFIALGGRASIYSASANSKMISEITYCTIGSIKSLGLKFKGLGFTKIILDECHLFNRDISGMLGTFLKESGIKHCLGFTATPLKLQNNLDINGNAYSKLVMLTTRNKTGQFFKDIIHVGQIQEMVDLKFWSKLIYEEYEVDNSKLIYNSTKADYTEESLERAYKLNNIHGKIIQKLAEINDRKSILVFVPSVADAKSLAAITPNSVAVYGDMDKRARDHATRGFRAGLIRVAFNVNLWATGFDHTQIDAIICARQTASIALYYQQIGRATRIHPDKKDCLIVDFSGNVKKFGKIEKLYFKKEQGVWKLYGEGGVLLTGVPLHEIGKHTEQSESEIKVVRMPFGKFKNVEVKNLTPSYRYWLAQNINWRSDNDPVKKEIERLDGPLVFQKQNQPIR